MSRNVKKTENISPKVEESANEKARRLIQGEVVMIGSRVYGYRKMNVGTLAHGCQSCEMYYRCTIDMADVCAELDILSGADCCLVEVE